MPANNDKLTELKQRNKEKQEQLTRLEQELAEKQAHHRATEKQLMERQAQFNVIQRKLKAVSRLKRNCVRFMRSTAAYLLGRRNIKQLYSKPYKRKKAENQLKKYRYYLYELGFIERALADLEAIYEQPENRYQKRAVSWELALWHAGKYTKEGAIKALNYLPAVMNSEHDQERLRKAAIIKAECHDILDEPEKGKHVISVALQREQHPDLYLAYANLEETIEARTAWLNKVMKAYKLQPVYFASGADSNPVSLGDNHFDSCGNDGNSCEGSANLCGESTNSCDSGGNSCDGNRNSCENLMSSCDSAPESIETATYDDLTTKPMDKTIENGPKVSVILPAYNAGDGISIAIESILSQTWQNIELLVVDDCSSDNTKDVVREHMKHDSRITLLSTPENSGPYIARNIALKAATGDFVTVNDSDDWSHAEKIEIQAKHLQKNKKIIANTSEHARLTEALQFYRRGTPGKYIFSNMSSLMFRREPVIKKVGYWDSVRFAADGEFKRRLVKVFGSKNFVGLKTGPLSLPRQSVTSLTGSSAFGYNGFFKGVRKEYVESFEFHHKRTNSLYYPPLQSSRFFPVPEPMWPKRQEKPAGNRHFDSVVAADFRLPTDSLKDTIDEIRTHESMGLRTGLIQMAEYTFNTAKKVNPDIRELIDGQNIQMLVYGESITCDILLVKNPAILQEKQQYIPNIKPAAVLTVIERTGGYNIRTASKRLMTYFDKKGKWYAKNDTIRDTLVRNKADELRFVYLAHDNWPAIQTENQISYKMFLENWLVDTNPYTE
ncbi:glycosyltransferase [Lentibacillus jeotgali]|uniref:glycosyltransferase n=1 Tax=Lentibacillus jeotgali TaxID=558169 RepID=UPI0002626481|nr:glycosyltransferase [Lentibacillus jeotgali]